MKEFRLWAFEADMLLLDVLDTANESGWLRQALRAFYEAQEAFPVEREARQLRVYLDPEQDKPLIDWLESLERRGQKAALLRSAAYYWLGRLRAPTLDVDALAQKLVLALQDRNFVAIQGPPSEPDEEVLEEIREVVAQFT